MGGLIEMEQKGCESIIHDHDCAVWVTLVTGVTSDLTVLSKYLVIFLYQG